MLQLIKTPYGLLLITLLAFGLRVQNLTYHSLWFDEAVSVHWASQTISRILEVGFTLEEDRLPPLYYLALKGWTQLAGFSEFSVRFLSVVCGTLLVPVIGQIARHLFSPPVAVLTALLVSFNPFLIWYSQEARMYAPGLLFITLAIWTYLPLTCSRPPTGWPSLAHHLLFIFWATLALYCHLYTGFLLAGFGLWLLISQPRRWRLWLAYGVDGVVMTCAYAPILAAIWRFSGEAQPGDPLAGLPERAWWLLNSFVVWQAKLDSPWDVLIPGLVALSAILGLGRGIISPKLRQPTLLIALLTFTPFAIANLLLARNHLAFFGERYFIVMVPWLLMLAGVGAKKQRLKSERTPIRNMKYVILLCLSLILLIPLPNQWDTLASKEAWRQSVDYLATHATEADGILIHPDWVRYPFQFYFDGPGQTYAAFSNVTETTDLDGPLNGVVGDHEVIWLIQSHHDAPDPNRLVEQWFSNRYPLVTELYPPGIVLKGFAPGYQRTDLPQRTDFDTLSLRSIKLVETDLELPTGMRLRGYEMAPYVAAQDTLFHPPSGWLHVTLYWSLADNGQPVEDSTPYLHLIGPEGVWGASLDRPTDALRLYPPSRWSAEQVIRHDLDVNLNPTTPPGTYQLWLGLYDYEELFYLTDVVVE